MLTHDREFFYKYVTSDTAIAILENMAVRYSSPIVLNDPFDNQFAVTKEFADERVVSGVFAHAVENEYSKRGIKVENKNFQSMFKTLGLDEQIFNVLQGYKELLNLGIRAVTRINKIFCVTENYDNLLMWAHYSDCHRGAVIKFRCLPEEDTALCIAEKVKYETEMPSLDLESFMSNFDSQEIGQKILNNITLTKSIDWAYENEWRVILPQKTQGDFYNMPILEREIDSIYFGCKMDSANKSKLLDLVKNLSHVKIFQAIKDSYLYKLNFEQIR